MLGILIAFAAAGIVAVLTLIRRELPLFLLIGIFVLAAEIGEGFTSFQGSIFFNPGALNLAKLKLIEVILYAYAGVLFLLSIPLRRKLARSSLLSLYLLWLAWMVVLLFVQFDTRGSVDINTVRGVLFGWAFSYVLVAVVDNRQIMQRAMVYTFALLIIKALWLMLMFAVGRGDSTPRGHSPIFWDDKLLGAYTWAALVFLRFIVQPRDHRGGARTTVAYAGLALISVLIALSLRRNYLGQLVIGAMFVLVHRAGRVQMQRFLSLAVVAAVLLGIVFTAGQVVGDRLPLVRQLTEYAQLLNFTSPTSFSSVPANQVHLFNVQTYVTLISNYVGIQLFGRSAAPVEDFRNFNRDYLSSLGLAHNGPLRAIFDFGIGGLLIWAGLFYLAFASVRGCRFEALESWEGALVTGTAATIFANLVVTMTVVPPFFTTFKGMFFFLLMVHILEFYGGEAKALARQSPGVTPLPDAVGRAPEPGFD